jgi:hypothetical protein
MVEGMGREGMRAADADRQQVADRLRAALEEGRLDLHEYDERVQRAYAAKTYGDLDGLLTDLPVTGGAVQPVTSAAVQPQGRPTAVYLASVWSSWFFVVGLCTVIWGVISLASFEVQYFWPVWVAMPWGLALAVYTVGGLTGGAPQKMAAERERKALAKEHRRQRRALITKAIAQGELPKEPSKEQRRAFFEQAIARGDLSPKPDKTQ